MIPLPGPEVPKVLKEITAFSSEGFLEESQFSGRRENDERNDQERSCEKRA